MSESNGFASREELLALGKNPKRRYKDVTLPVSGLKVRIQSLMEDEASKYSMAVMARGKGARPQVDRSRILDAPRRLIVWCIVDGDGNRLLTGQDVDILASWDNADTQYLYDVCAKHCGIDDSSLEDLAGNSGDTQGD